ncbi:MAG: hypothetical protein KDC83_14710 [Flavobacteriales bacterium]|nr:hypothetical protein [Flavobacteriales bacterium]
MENAQIQSLSAYHPLITPGRDTGNGYYLSGRKFPSGDVEISAVKLTHEDRLRRGGGAKRKNNNKSDMSEVVLNKSQWRARKAVRHLCLSLQTDRLMTLTVRENLTDINKAWDCFKYFCKLMRWRYKDQWAYVAAPEFQKRGAVHFHLAIRGYFHANTVRRFWNRALGQMSGNIDITSPRKRGQNPKRIANYISKYITKQDSSEFNRRRYSSGGNIEVPAPLHGWLALGVPAISVIGDAMREMTRKSLREIWESEGYFDIIFMST